MPRYIGEESASQRLYDAALLGSSLAQQSGEIAGSRSSQEAAAHQRAATLRAGVASGKIKASSLSAADAGLLGSALNAPKIKVPSLFGDPLGFAGGLASNFAKGAGEFVGSLPKVPQGLYDLGKAGIEEGRKTILGDKPGEAKAPFMEQLGKIGESVVHDFSSPQQIYEHPFNPALDVATLASGGAGAVGKVAKGLSDAGVDSGIVRAAAKIGSPLGRAPATTSPGFDFNTKDLEWLKDTTGHESTVRAAQIPRMYSTKSPFMKYAVQKPLDTLLKKSRNVHVPLTDRNIGELQGDYYGKRLINRLRAQTHTGAAEEFAVGSTQDFLNKSVTKMFSKGQGAGAYQFEATMLHNMGINSVDKLEAYADKLRNGEDVNGELTQQGIEVLQHRLKMYEDPRFVKLVEDPTDVMKELAYHMRKINVENAMKANIDPLTTENGAFGRLRMLTGKSIDELKSELPSGMEFDNAFAKELQKLQELMLGKGEAETEPSLEHMAGLIPYGKKEQRLLLLEKAVKSFADDLDHKNPYQNAQEDPNYLMGNTLFAKIASGLRDLGVEPEQAQSFARGVPLGSAEGPIIPTYTPSATGKGMKFGLRPETMMKKIGRMTGMSDFEALSGEGDVARQPTFYNFKRPFRPRTISAQTVGLGPQMGYFKDAEYKAFMDGTMRLDPDLIANNAFQIQRDIIARKLNDSMVQRLALKDTEGEMKMFRGYEDMEKQLGEEVASKYTFVNVNVWRSFFKTDSQLQSEMGRVMGEGASRDDIMQQLEEMADEMAQQFVQGEEMTLGMNPKMTEGVALPNTFVNTIVKHRQLMETNSPLARLTSILTSRWKYATLSLMPAWFVRTTVGHGLVALIDGTLPGKYALKAHTLLKDRPVMQEDLHAIDWGKRYGNEMLLGSNNLPFGVNQGGMLHELQDTGQGGRRGLLMGRVIQHGVHDVTNWQRRAIYLRKLDDNMRFSDLEKAIENPGGFWSLKNVDAVNDPKWLNVAYEHPDLIEHAFDQLSQVSYTFGDMAPWERRLIKYGFPFWGWYKFISKFVWSLPAKYPGRANALGLLGHLGQEDVNQLGPIPGYLEGALWYDHSNMENAKYMNVYGLNPMGDVANPLGPEGAFQGTMRLGQMSPIIQALMAGYGINPMSGEKESIDPRTGIEQGRFGELFNTKTGQELPGIFAVNGAQRTLGTFLRAFPEIRSLELLHTGGNPVFPESIPLIDEHPIGVHPASRRGGTSEGAIEQEFGFQPRGFDLQDYQRRRAKALREAIKANPRTVRKQERKLHE